jgi:uncharacterized protein YbjT (DUF2867 family)
MRIIVTGVTGLVGAEVLRAAVAHPRITAVTALGRRPPRFTHPKITPLIHNDFNDFGSLEGILKEHDAIVWCLGVSQTQVNAARYEEITYGYTLAAADTIVKKGIPIRFIFISGEGADTSEQSRTLFARIKGKTENALLRTLSSGLFILRPGGIRPVNHNPDAPFTYKLLLPLFPLAEWLKPSSFIRSDVLGRVIVEITLDGTGKQLLDNRDLRRLAGLS